MTTDDASVATFQKILDMKGLKKSEQQPLVEVFHSLAPAPEEDGEGGGDGKAGKKKKAAASPKKGNTNLRKLEKLMKRFQ